MLLKLKRFHQLSLSKTDLTKALNHYVTVIYEHSILHRGLVPTLRKCKTLYGIMCRIAASHSFTPMDFTKVNKSGYPKILGPLIALLRGTVEERKCALTIGQLYKLVDGSDNKIDLSTIIERPVLDPLNGTDDICVGNYLSRALDLIKDSPYDHKMIIRAYNLTLMETFPTNKCDNRLSDISKKSNIHISSKGGPNGPSIGGIPADFSALLDFESGAMLTNLVKMSRLTENNKLFSVIREYYSDNPQIKQTIAGKSNIPLTSKLSVKNETGGRNRLFAIGDWFSQSALKGFHEYLFDWLRSQPEDGTHDQDRVSNVVREWTKSPLTQADGVNSTDLTAATDRIPIEMQTEIVAQIAGFTFAQLWRSIMVDRDFKTPFSDDSVRYAVGQPMGLLSSWAMLAVWHHIICRTCLKYYELHRDPNLLNYVVIGDDVCIKGDVLGELYAFIVRDLCGVKISSAKGFSKETLTELNFLPQSTQMHVAEIAKRIFVNGIELTSLSPELIKSALENSSDFPNLLNKMDSKGGYDLTNLQREGPNLIDLTRKTRRSVLLASFPLKPAAPYQGVTKLYLENNLPDWAQKIPWFDAAKPRWTMDYIELDYLRIIRREAVSSLFASLALIAEWNASKDSDVFITIGGWEFKNLVLLNVMTMIIEESAETINSLNDPSSDNYPIVDGRLNLQRLEQYLKRILVLFELNLVFSGKNIYGLTTKQREGKLIASCILALQAETQESREAVFEKRKQETLNTWDRLIAKIGKKSDELVQPIEVHQKNP